DDRVEHRYRLQGRGGGAIGRMLVRLRRDVDQALVIGQRGSGHESKGSRNQRSLTRMTSRNPLHVSSIAATLLSTSAAASPSWRPTCASMSVGPFDAFFGHATHSPAFGTIAARSAGSRRSSVRRSTWNDRITSAGPRSDRIAFTPSSSNPSGA